MQCGHAIYRPAPPRRPLPVITEGQANTGTRYQRAAQGNRKTKAAFVDWRAGEVRTQILAGATTSQIAADWNLTKESARGVMRSAAKGYPEVLAILDAQGKAGQRARHDLRRAVRAERQRKVARLHKEGMAKHNMASLLGVSSNTIRLDLKQLGLPIK